MSVIAYPVRVDASLQPQLSRWLWLVKWLLVLPHYLVLAFLWLAFVVLSMVAFFAIVFTGRYPRQIFDFNVGVLRWSWRVTYYAYGALGTDRYPPFTLHDVADYPAHLDIAYPEHLSRGLVWVKWWLLALPHYLVIAVFLGAGMYVATDASAASNLPWLWGGGLIGLLVLIAGVVLLFTGSYPRSIFDLIMGMNRWVLRVSAYAGLMTDDYPPFRLDMGSDDPGSPGFALQAPVTPTPSQESSATLSQQTSVPTSGPPQPSPQSSSTSGWTAGRVVAIVLGCLVFVVAGGLIAGGITLAVAQGAVRDDTGFLMSAEEEFQTPTHAITSSNMEMRMADSGGFVPERLLGDTKLMVTPLNGKAVFVGIGATAEVEDYLAGVAHTTVVEFTNGAAEPVYQDLPGEAPTTAPAGAVTWAAQASGTGPQGVVWSLEEGDWTIVVMNADGSADVAVDLAAGAEFPAIGTVVAVLLSLGGCLLILAAVLIIGALRAAGTEEAKRQ